MVTIMRYYKTISNGYIISIGIGEGGTEITESEYSEIVSVIAEKPETTETTDYRLKDNLTWEFYEVEPVTPEPTEQDYAEAGRTLMGVES